MKGQQTNASPRLPRTRVCQANHAALKIIVALSLGAAVTFGSGAGTPLAGQPASQTGVISARGQAVAIVGGWLFDPVDGARVRNAGILARNARLLSVGVELTANELEGARVLELTDRHTILPGFFDLHAHYNMILVGGARREEYTYNPILFLANGVTSTFPAGEFDPDPMARARERIDSGQQIGPRIFSSGPYFGAARCPGTRTHRDECDQWPNDITEPEIRAEVDYWVSRGMKSIKVKLASPEEMRIVIDQAHRYGVTVTSHLHNYNTFSSDPGERVTDLASDVHHREAIRMGIDRIEHTIVPTGDIFAGTAPPGSEPFDELVSLFLDHDVYFNPTMAVYGRGTLMADSSIDLEWVDEIKFFTPYTQERIRERAANRRPGGNPDYAEIFKHKVPELEAFYEAGGGHLITTGTDRPTSGPHLAGFEFHREMQTLAYAGLPPAVVLAAATINGARALRVGDQLGSVEVGKLADLVVVEGNPLDDIRATRHVQFVMKAGQLYDPAVLLRSVEGKIGPRSETDEPAWSH